MGCTDFLQVYWSLYFDHWMKNIVHKVVPLYVKSAEILIDDWLTHSFPNKLPLGSILFIYMHFISMYSNIDTEYGIRVVRDYILPKISRRYPKWLPHWSLTLSCAWRWKKEEFESSSCYYCPSYLTRPSFIYVCYCKQYRIL